MKRILFGGILAASLILLQPSSAPLADENQKSEGWMTEKGKDGDIKVLRLWKVPSLGLQWPQIALLRLNEAQKQALLANPLEFLSRYRVYPEKPTRQVAGEFSIRLQEDPYLTRKDDALAVIGHGQPTYSGVAVFEVDKIQPVL